jgi:beta-fructofuranosidase
MESHFHEQTADCARRGFLKRAGALGIALGGVSRAPGESAAAEESGVPGELVLNYHLMHPGGPSAPGDPNAAFCLDGVYHLHYILRHPFRGKTSFCFVHVSSPDMLHWKWHKTRLQPSFTGHGMFSGTGFLTREGKPAAIYHGQGSGRNQIAIARDHTLEEWEKPYPVEPMTNGRPAQVPHWDPDCFLIDGTFYAISGGQKPALMKSRDLKAWSYVGDFLAHNLPDVAIGEDVSCGNFFRLGRKWMMLCISHSFGCRYYLGDWDARGERFVPTSHARMNWRREDQSIHSAVYRDFFAPESVLTPDGRRVMWAWCTTLNPLIDSRTVQALPRELSLGADGGLRIRPLRELESLRGEVVRLSDLEVRPPASNTQGGVAIQRLAALEGEALEIRIVVARAEAERKRFGFQLFAGEKHEGLPVLFQPETGSLRLGGTEAPFSVAALPRGEDVELRIFIDKYLVEVFANGRQAMIAAHMDYRGGSGLNGYSFGDPTKIRSVEIWKLKAANQGFLEAQQSRIWEPDVA